MTIQTKQYGTVEIAQEQCIEFPLGIIGFEHLRSFSLIDSEVPHFYILQSLEDVDISFFVINPYLVYPSYQLEVNDEDLDDIKCVDSEKLLVFSIITIPEVKEDISCNLLGPILINKETKLGRQSIALGDLSTKHYFLRDKANPETEAVGTGRSETKGRTAEQVKTSASKAKPRAKVKDRAETQVSHART